MIINTQENLLQDKYERLLKNHQNLQEINHDLETKILDLVEKHEKEKNDHLERIQILSRQVYNLSTAISEIEKENERYKRDCSLAVHLLRCKPNSYVNQPFNLLPEYYQRRLERTGWDTHNNASSNVLPGSVPYNGNHFISSTFPPTAAAAIFMQDHRPYNNSPQLPPPNQLNGPLSTLCCETLQRCQTCSGCLKTIHSDHRTHKGVLGDEVGEDEIVVPNVLVANLLLETEPHRNFEPYYSSTKPPPPPPVPTKFVNQSGTVEPDESFASPWDEPVQSTLKGEDRNCVLGIDNGLYSNQEDNVGKGALRDTSLASPLHNAFFLDLLPVAEQPQASQSQRDLQERNKHHKKTNSLDCFNNLNGIVSSRRILSELKISEGGQII